MLTLLPETPGVYLEWKRLIFEHRVLGIKVFDARLAAVARENGVDSILTFNGADFRRYGRPRVIEP